MDYSGISVKDKVIIVIGGTGGIGSALANGLAKEKAVVVPTSRSLDRVKETVEKIEALGAASLACTVDITSEESIGKLVSSVVDRFERIDVLINAAGTHIKKPTVEMSEEEWDKVLDVNLKGVFLTSKIVGKQMIKQKKGKIINIGSMASFVALNQTAAYCASKGGVLQLTKALAQEWAKYNINVNAIHPGFFLTPLNKDVLKEGTKRRKDVDERTPLGRVGNVEELIGAVVYLASDASDFVTGTGIVVDGGFLAEGI